MVQATPQLATLRAYRTSTLTAYSLVVERTVQAMRSHVAEPLSLHEMAEIACLSPFHFNRVFRAIVGTPPGEFFAALRLHAAKRLLLTTSLSVTEVCFELGYASLGTFTQHFTQLIGLPPLRLRQLADELSPAPLASFRDRRPAALVGETAICRLGVSGAVTAPGPFTGLIFVGLFPKPIPQGSPVACVTLTAPGPYRLALVPDGCYFLLGAALPRPQDALAYLLPETGLLVGVAGRPVLVRDGRTSAPVDLALRPPYAADPPILGVFPPLLASAPARIDRTLFAIGKIEEAS